MIYLEVGCLTIRCWNLDLTRCMIEVQAKVVTIVAHVFPYFFLDIKFKICTLCRGWGGYDRGRGVQN